MLQLYYDPAATSGKEILITAYQLMESCSQTGGYHRILLDSKRVTSYRSQFVEFDVTRAVRTWTAKRSSYYGLEVEVVNDQCSDISLPNASTLYSTYLQPSGTAVPRDQRPSLFVMSDFSYFTSWRQRGRRQTLDFDYCGTLDPTQPNCCIRDFRLNLKTDLGWDWIVQPKTINLNQCAGDCPPRWAEDSNYTQVRIRWFRD